MSWVVLEIKCGNEHKISAQCLAQKKGCYPFLLFIISHVIIIIITMSQNSSMKEL